MKKKIEKVKLEIDKIFEEKESKGSFGCDEEGGGRKVVFIGDFAVKFPIESGKIWCDGVTQNLKELEIYLNTKHENLVPIYGTHKGCLICKKIVDVYELFHDEEDTRSPEDIDKEIKEGMSKLEEVIKEYDLERVDMAEYRNWGYDYEEDRFMCLDYGIVNHEW